MFGLFKKIISPFSKISSRLGQKIKSLFAKGANDASFDELEKLLYEADVGAEMAADLVEQVKKKVRNQKETSSEEIISYVKSKILESFTHPTDISYYSPHVILVVGVNGSGKTTTLAKLAQKFKNSGKKVLIAAGDTFRAAAIEQLETWSHRIGVDIVTAQPKSDPSAVAYDALQASLSRKTDIVLIDTAGRLQNKTDLMHELSKICRVIKKLIPDAPHETLLVLDSTIGQNAIDQAKTFHQFTPLTGIVLTKLDGSAKGGIAISIQKQLHIPIRWVGLGEDADDLIPFHPEEYVEALFK